MILRSTKELTYEPVNNLKGIIALEVSEWNRDKINNRYIIKVIDYLVKDVLDPLEGEPLKTYERINTRTVIRSPEQINGLFSFLATDINFDLVDELGNEITFSDQLDLLISKGLSIDTQGKPIYMSEANDWILINKDLEIA